MVDSVMTNLPGEDAAKEILGEQTQMWLSTLGQEQLAIENGLQSIDADPTVTTVTTQIQ